MEPYSLSEVLTNSKASPSNKVELCWEKIAQLGLFCRKQRLGCFSDLRQIFLVLEDALQERLLSPDLLGEVGLLLLQQVQEVDLAGA